MMEGARMEGEDDNIVASRMARGSGDAPEVVGVVLVRDDLDDEPGT